MVYVTYSRDGRGKFNDLQHAEGLRRLEALRLDGEEAAEGCRSGTRSRGQARPTRANRRK